MTFRPWGLREYKKPESSPLKDKWKTHWGPRKQYNKAMQMSGMRKVPITLAPVPRSKVLTDEELL